MAATSVLNISSTFFFRLAKGMERCTARTRVSPPMYLRAPSDGRGMMRPPKLQRILKRTPPLTAPPPPLAPPPPPLPPPLALLQTLLGERCTSSSVVAPSDSALIAAIVFSISGRILDVYMFLFEGRK